METIATQMSFLRKDYLREHERYHTGERPFQCDICKKTYKRKSHLLQHGKYHSEEKPFQCSICAKPFAFKSDLKKHTRIHTGEKPFKCDLCIKVFAHSNNLAAHKRTHTGEKPFQCLICKSFFSRKDNRDRHERNHAREEPFCSDYHLRLFKRSLQNLSDPVTYAEFYFSTNTFTNNTTSSVTLTKIQECITIFGSKEQLLLYFNLGLLTTKYFGYYTDIPTLHFILFTLFY